MAEGLGSGVLSLGCLVQGVGTYKSQMSFAHRGVACRRLSDEPDCGLLASVSWSGACTCVAGEGGGRGEGAGG